MSTLETTVLNRRPTKIGRRQTPPEREPQPVDVSEFLIKIDLGEYVETFNKAGIREFGRSEKMRSKEGFFP